MESYPHNYEIADGSSRMELIRNVNKGIALGWQPVGGIFWDGRHKSYCQSMVRVEPIRDRRDEDE